MQSLDVDSLVLALEGLFRDFRAAATAGELSLPAASVLGRLARSGGQRLTDLAAAERVSQPAMTQLVARLERDALTTKAPDSSDGRAVVVEITPAGRRVVEQRRRQRAEFFRRLVAAVGADDVAVINAAIPALGRLAALDEAPGHAPALAEGMRA